mgnify:CR=1 FL=1
MVRLGNFKKLELISPSGKSYIFDDDIETVFLSIEDDNNEIVTGFSSHFGGYDEDKEDYVILEIDGEEYEQPNTR